MMVPCASQANKQGGRGVGGQEEMKAGVKEGLYTFFDLLKVGVAGAKLLRVT